jgi:hypothetical protein
MKIPKVYPLLLVPAILLAGCSSTDANGVNITHGSIFDYLWSAPAPMPASPLAPAKPALTPQVPSNAPTAQPLASD